MNPSQVFQALQQNADAVLLDVREQYEYDQVHIPDSLLCPLSTFETHFPTHQIIRTTPLYVLCRSGTRSKKAITILKKMGYTTTHNIEDGILKWIEEELPTL